MAASLVYYDKVFVEMHGPDDFVAIVRYFKESGDLRALINLMGEGSLIPYHHMYYCGAQANGRAVVGIRHIQLHGRSHEFVPMTLESPELQASLADSPGELAEIQAVAASAAINVPMTEFGAAYLNAENDFFTRARCARVLRLHLQRRYPSLEGFVRDRIDVRCRQAITRTAELVYEIDWLVPPDVQDYLTKQQIVLPKPESLLSEVGRATRAIGAASSLSSDIWPGPVHVDLCADKIAEVVRRASKPARIVQELDAKVDFPDICTLADTGVLRATDLMHVRSKSKRFRDWLQTEKSRDREAIIAYHHEVSHETGLAKLGRSTLGVASVALGAVPGAIAGDVGLSVGGMVAASVVGEGVSYVIDCARKVNDGWRPVVFGEWLDKRVRDPKSP